MFRRGSVSRCTLLAGIVVIELGEEGRDVNAMGCALLAIGGGTRGGRGWVDLGGEVVELVAQIGVEAFFGVDDVC